MFTNVHDCVVLKTCNSCKELTFNSRYFRDEFIKDKFHFSHRCPWSPPGPGQLYCRLPQVVQGLRRPFWCMLVPTSALLQEDSNDRHSVALIGSHGITQAIK